MEILLLALPKKRAPRLLHYRRTTPPLSAPSGNNAQNMVANDNHMSQKLEYATLPRDAPRPDEDRVIFIVNGSEHLSWSLHHGLSENFAQMVTWVTPHVHPDELDLDPCQSLFSYAAPQALTYLFGGANVEMGTKEAAAAVNKKRKVPWSTVYVLSAGNSDQKETQTQEEGIEYLFRDYPARLFKLRSVDFFTPEQGLNSTMPVDKVAALYGAWKDHGGPLLLLHAGHTIWYSAIGNNSNLLGGGISSGLGIRFQSLSDYCQDSFPLIESDEFVAAIKTATEQKKPLSMFGTDTRVAMIANITAELYGQLRNVIKQFEAKVLGANATNGGTIAVPEDVTVVITGRDMVTVKKMLRDGKNIVDVEDGVTPPKTNPDHYCLRKNLSFTGIQQLLLDKIGKEEPPNADDELRDAIFGLRVAKAELGPGRVVVAGDIVRGSVVRISRGKAVEEDLFSILFDDGDQKWVSIVDFYGKTVDWGGVVLFPCILFYIVP